MPGGRWSRARLTGLCLSVAGALLVGVPAGSATADEAAPEVVWPTSTDWIRPVPYRFDVDVPGTDGELRAQVGSVIDVPISRQGPATVDLSSISSVYAQVDVVLCPTSGAECETVDTSPRIELYDDVTPLYLDDELRASSRPWTSRFELRPIVAGVLRWQLLLADGTTAATGETARGASGHVSLQVPLGTPEQTGKLVVDLVVDDATFGHRERRLEYAVRIDGVPPPAPSVTVDAVEFFPEPDQYRDELAITITSAGGGEVDLFARNVSTGVTGLVASALDVSAGRPRVVRSDGTQLRNGRWESLPPGEHELFAVTTDYFGQASAPSPGQRVTVRGESVVTVERTFRIPAASVLVQKVTGRCGRVTKPASRGWRRSIALRSSATCRDPRSYAQGVFAAWLPRGVRDSWSKVRVDVVGGPARGHRGDRLGIGLLIDEKKTSELYDPRVLRGHGVRTHRGPAISGGSTYRVVHETRTGRPYVIWTALTAGAGQFDIKEFRLTVAYPDLRL